MEQVINAVETTAEEKKYHNLSLVLFENEKKNGNTKSPDFLLKYKIADKKWEILGAAWKSKSGKNVIQISLDIDKMALYNK